MHNAVALVWDSLRLAPILAKWLGLGPIINTSNSCKCMGVNGEALQLHAVYKKAVFFTRSHTRIRISTTSHMRIRIKYCKLRALRLNVHNEIKGSHDKIIITIVPRYTRKNITCLLPLELFLLLRTCNNTDGNKLDIFQYSFVLW